VLCALGALFTTLWLRNPIFPATLFFGVVTVSTWYGGGTVGLVGVLFGTLALDYLFIPPVRTWTLAKPELPYLLEFTLPALLTCWFVWQRKVDAITLRKDRDELESRVLERQAELARVSRMMTIGEMGVSVAHEVNQPLMAIVLNADACLQWLSANPPNLDQARMLVSRIVEEGTRAGEIVRRIRNLSAKASVQRLPVDLNELVTEVTSLLDGEVSKHKVSLRTELAPDLPAVTGDRVQLQQVLFNVAMNGIEAMASQTARRAELLIRTRQLGSGLLISVEDSGPGLPPGDPEQLFTAFYTTKPEGVGIGLAISRTIIEAHGGRMRALNSDSGASFEIELPVDA